MEKKVSVIIPSYNRFSYLLNAIESVKKQTYMNIEIIVINDCSTEKEYYTHNFENCVVIHLPENSRQIFGRPCVNYVRNMGIWKSTGDYIAFLDDDDIWFPEKLSLQIKAMDETKCEMSATEGIIGDGKYDSNKKYKKYNQEHYYNDIVMIYAMKGRLDLMMNGYPKIWNLDFISVHNCIINSSVVITRNILNKMNNLRHIFAPGDDYDSWLNALKFTNCVYVDEVCFYYDERHGYGQNL